MIILGIASINVTDFYVGFFDMGIGLCGYVVRGTFFYDNYIQNTDSLQLFLLLYKNTHAVKIIVTLNLL